MPRMVKGDFIFDVVLMIPYQRQRPTIDDAPSSILNCWDWRRRKKMLLCSLPRRALYWFNLHLVPRVRLILSDIILQLLEF